MRASIVGMWGARAIPVRRPPHFSRARAANDLGYNVRCTFHDFCGKTPNLRAMCSSPRDRGITFELGRLVVRSPSIY